MSDLLQNIGDLDPEQRELLRLKMQKLRKKPAALSAEIEPQSRDRDLFPASLGQERLWFLDQLQPGSAVNNIPIAAHLQGRLNMPAFERSLNQLLERHEILRTTFEAVDGRLSQRLVPRLEVDLPTVDLTALSVADRQIEVERGRRLEAGVPFDVERGPLLRFALLRLSPKTYVLLFTIHHIIFDRWSLAVFLEDLGAFYRVAVTPERGSAQPSPPPPLVIQYADFAAWQRSWLAGPEPARQLEYWKEHLDGCELTLDLPTDHQRADDSDRPGTRLAFSVSPTVTDSLHRLSGNRGASLFHTLLAAYELLLYLYAGTEDDVVVGLSVANRGRKHLDRLIGYFTNHLAVRTDLSGEPSFEELLTRVKDVILAAHAHQDLPTEKLVEELRRDRDREYQSLFQVMFRLNNAPMPVLDLPGLAVEVPEPTVERAPFDLDLSLEESEGGLRGELIYRTDLFEADTAEALVQAYVRILERAVAEPSAVISRFDLGSELTAKAKAAKARRQQQTLAVAATFSAGLIEGSLAFWMNELELPSRIAFAPYNQIFQELLDDNSLLATNDRGFNILLVRFEDWLTGEASPQVGEQGRKELERAVGDLSDALGAAVERSSVTHLLCFCPSSPAMAPAGVEPELFREMEARLARQLEGRNGICLISAEELRRLYPVADYYDATTDGIGHVPFTIELFTALGTLIARRIHTLASRPPKVLAVDCDNTLWRGVCAEDGPLGVTVDAGNQALQRQLVAQHDAGLLVCLCSKNEDPDVVEVFRQRRDMVLNLDHVIARKVNWQPKSENLLQLARELDLGLDSFVFIDDNPVECAEVEAACPEVTVLRLPTAEEEIPRFLDHVWAFDRLRVTEADRQRTELYRQNLEREKVRHEALDLKSFIAGLELEVSFSALREEQVPRLSQLTQRINQFNATSLRLSEAEVRSRYGESPGDCQAVRTRDRFGDYGLVGVMMFRQRAETLEVENFLLSCRALGRGVEHHMLARLGELAQERGCEQVRVPFLPAERNEPMRHFLESVGSGLEEAQGGGLSVTLSAAQAAETSYLAGDGLAQPEARRKPTAKPAARHSGPRPALAMRIATELHDVADILGEISSGRRRQDAEELVAPRNPIEETLAEIWTEVLGIENVGVFDNFFRVGGHSLLWTVVLSRIQIAFDVELSLTSIFENPTIAGVAQAIEASLLQEMEGEDLSESLRQLGDLSEEELQELLAEEQAALSAGAETL